MAALGFNAAIRFVLITLYNIPNVVFERIIVKILKEILRKHNSVRVSNELGAGHPRTAKFTVAVVAIFAFFLGVILAAILLIFRDDYPSLFSDSTEVQELVYKLTPLLATCIVINNVQPVLSGSYLSSASSQLYLLLPFSISVIPCLVVNPMP